MHCRHRLFVSSTPQQLRKKAFLLFPPPMVWARRLPPPARLIRGNFLWQLPPSLSNGDLRRATPLKSLSLLFAPFCGHRCADRATKKIKIRRVFSLFLKNLFRVFPRKVFSKRVYCIRKWTFFELVKKQAISKHFSPVSRPTKNRHSCGGGGCTKK